MAGLTNNELKKKNGKELVMEYHLHLPGRAEENNDKLQSGLPVPCQDFPQNLRPISLLSTTGKAF
jgi:hypothetical protein